MSAYWLSFYLVAHDHETMWVSGQFHDYSQSFVLSNYHRLGYACYYLQESICCCVIYACYRQDVMNHSVLTRTNHYLYLYFRCQPSGLNQRRKGAVHHLTPSRSRSICLMDGPCFYGYSLAWLSSCSEGESVGFCAHFDLSDSWCCHSLLTANSNPSALCHYCPWSHLRPF